MAHKFQIYRGTQIIKLKNKVVFKITTATILNLHIKTNHNIDRLKKFHDRKRKTMIE